MGRWKLIVSLLMLLVPVTALLASTALCDAPIERDPEATHRWVEEEYSTIRALARQHAATIFWGDEMGLRSDHQAGRSWGRRGEIPVVPGTGQRFRYNVISVITNRGWLAFKVFKGRFTYVMFIRFLRRVLRHTQRPGFLIIDEHPVHRSTKVKRWVARRGARLRLFFLPGYSPDLNPDEYLNNDVKTNAVGRQRPHNQGELMNNVRGYLRSTQRQPKKVRRYFHHPSVRYAAGMSNIIRSA